MVGIRVFGISLDSVQNQAEFHEQQELNFPLLSDPDGSAALKYGTLAEGGRYTNRITCVIDPDGILRKIDTSVQVNTHGEDLVLMVEELQQ